MYSLNIEHAPLGTNTFLSFIVGPTATTLPLWNGTPAVTQGINYSIISTPGATNNGTHHAEQDSVTSNGNKRTSS